MSAPDLHRRFGTNVALMDGSNHAYNLCYLALLTLLPGLQAQTAVFTLFVLLTARAAMQIPFGYLADRYGTKKILYPGLCIELMALLIMIGVCFCSARGYWSLLWPLLILECLVDAAADASICGIFEVSYGIWYNKELENRQLSVLHARPLFLESYRYGLPWRLGIPLFCLVLGPLVFHFKEHLSFWPQWLAIPLVFIILVKIILMMRIITDLKELPKKEQEQRTKQWRNNSKMLLQHRLSLMTYSFFYLLQILVNMSFSGEIYQLVKLVFPSSGTTWTMGMGLGLLVSFFTATASKIVFPMMGELRHVDGLVRQSLFVASLLGGLIFLLFTQPVSSEMRLMFFALSTLISAIMASMIKMMMTTQTQKTIPLHIRSSWFSAANLMTLVLFGIINGSVLLLGIPRMNVGIFGLWLMIIGLFLGIKYQQEDVRDDARGLHSSHPVS